MNNFTVTSLLTSNMCHNFCTLYYGYLRVVTSHGLIKTWSAQKLLVRVKFTGNPYSYICERLPLKYTQTRVCRNSYTGYPYSAGLVLVFMWTQPNGISVSILTSETFGKNLKWDFIISLQSHRLLLKQENSFWCFLCVWHRCICPASFLRLELITSRTCCADSIGEKMCMFSSRNCCCCCFLDGNMPRMSVLCHPALVEPQKPQ